MSGGVGATAILPVHRAKSRGTAPRRRSPAACRQPIRKWACAEVKSALGLSRVSSLQDWRPGVRRTGRAPRSVRAPISTAGYSRRPASSGAGAGAELVEQGGLVRLGGLEVAHLDVAEAADFFRDRGKPHRDVVVVRGRASPAPPRASPRSRASAGARSCAPPSSRTDRTAVPRRNLSFASNREQREDPRAERHLFRLAGGLVACAPAAAGRDARAGAAARRRARCSPA